MTDIPAARPRRHSRSNSTPCQPRSNLRRYQHSSLQRGLWRYNDLCSPSANVH